jgi:hypothetical protein
MNWNRMQRIAVTLVVIALASVPAQAQVPEGSIEPPRQSPSPPAGSVAQRMLLAAYPELRDRRIDWRVDGSGSARVLEAREAVSPLAGVSSGSPAIADASASSDAGATPPAPPLVRAVVELDQAGALVALHADGALARPPAFTALQAAPNPTADTLRAAGAKFPPDDPAGPVGLVPAGVVQVLGATDVATPTFTTAAAPGEADALTWHVGLTGTVKDPLHTYTLVFEPLEGRLQSVVRR